MHVRAKGDGIVGRSFAGDAQTLTAILVPCLWIHGPGECMVQESGQRVDDHESGRGRDARRGRAAKQRQEVRKRRASVMNQLVQVVGTALIVARPFFVAKRRESAGAYWMKTVFGVRKQTQGLPERWPCGSQLFTHQPRPPCRRHAMPLQLIAC